MPSTFEPQISPPEPPRRVLAARRQVSLAVMTLAVAIFAAATKPGMTQTPEPPAAWRVECSGDGKSLDCRAIQQIFQRDTRQLIAAVIVRYVASSKAAMMSIQLPLGLNLTEPVLIKVDSGPPERQVIQTCNNSGCFVSMTLSDKFLAAMRTGSEIKVTVQDAGKNPVDMALPLLGFGLAFDKAK
jgi:invasion protein IalB